MRLIIPLGIDIVHISIIEYGKGLYSHYPTGTHPDVLIRRALPPGVKVIGVGSIIHPDRAVRVLDDGLDLVALGRALLLDAQWARKVASGQIDSIRMNLGSEEEIPLLDIPGPMKTYVKGRLPITSA